MSKVYGQNPSQAVSGVKRHDEFAGSITQQDSELGRKQDVAQIGQTLPLVFCWREGGDGGTWISPRLVGIGFEGNYVYLAYIVSQGVTGKIEDDVIWIGNQPLSKIRGVTAQYGYEELPNGSMVVNQPGRLPQLNYEAFQEYTKDAIDPGLTAQGGFIVESQTSTCTGMEFALINTTTTVYSIKIYAYDRNDGFALIKTANFTQGSFSITVEILQLPPANYLFVVELSTSYVGGLEPSLVGSIEHYQAGDGVTPLPTYKDMTLLGVKAEYWELFRKEDNYRLAQVHAFVSDGIYVDDVRNAGAQTSPSNLYPNLVNYLMRNAIKLDDALIDTASLALIANMNNKYDLWFNGVLGATVSFQEWVFRTSSYFWASPAANQW